jgi:hypothetical protein
LAGAIGGVWVLWFLYVGLPYRLRFLALGLAALFVWLAIGVWKGAPRRSLALGTVGLVGTGWFLRVMAEVPRSSLDGAAIQRPAGWYVIVGIEAGFAFAMGLLSLSSWHRATRRADAAPAVEPVDV